MKSGDGLGRAYWICAGFTLFSAIVSAGFSLLSLRMAGGHEYALYAASRSVALPLATIYAIARRSRAGMATLAVAMTLVQLFDGIIGLRLHDPGRAYGPFVFAAINLGLLYWMNRTSNQQSKAIPAGM
ncbi:hypothetical protein [Granulicella sp. dw_53]|uniref:hypothetical protein n=1 Tax=Granulicella sp. dw_53 TaxID=2719792 RepID=UPI001BD50F3B|nr:hypothetical protein [Granulicella sp. dw_53]